MAPEQSKFLFLDLLIRNASTTLESSVQIITPVSGILSNLFVGWDGNHGSGATVTFTIRVNGIDSPLKTTYNTALKGVGFVSNTSDEVNVKPGDLISLKFTEIGGPFSGAANSFSISFYMK